MVLGAMFERLIPESPLSVMARAAVEHALSASAPDARFERTAEKGCTQELLFSTVMGLMSAVGCGQAHHVPSADPRMADRMPMTPKLVCEKRPLLESGVSAALVRHAADRCPERIAPLGGVRCFPGAPFGCWTGTTWGPPRSGCGIVQRKGAFVTRRHAMTLSWERESGSTDTGTPDEQTIGLTEPGGAAWAVRWVRLTLGVPIRDGTG